MSSILTDTIAQIIAAVLTTLISAILIQLFRWLQSKINATEIGQQISVDDLIFNALTVGISNMSNTLAAELKAKAADGKLTEEDKKELRIKAIEEARKVLNPLAKEAFEKLSHEDLKPLIRYIVDKISKK